MNCPFDNIFTLPGTPFNVPDGADDNKKEGIPRYLFRLHSNRTAGHTCPKHIISPASAAGCANDLYSLRKVDAAKLLYSHLTWDWAHEASCNFMSWSSSMLFLLQYGLHRHFKDLTPLSEIYLLVIDTRGFPEDTFVRDMQLIQSFKAYSVHLEGFYNNVRTRDLPGGGKYYFGEYLSQGVLDIAGRSSQASMQSLIDFGLFDLCPGLGDSGQWNLWAKAVVAIREQAFRGSPGPGPMPKSEFRKTLVLASACFGDDWALLVVIQLLALKRRQSRDPVISNGIKAAFTSEFSFEMHTSLIE